MAYRSESWVECKRKCRFNEADIERAKRLGLNPKSLIKNVPNKKQQWKAPVKDWLIAIETKRSKKADQKARRKNKGREN